MATEEEPSPKKRRVEGETPESCTNGKIFSTLADMQAGLPSLWHEDERVLQLRCATLAGRANGLAPLCVVDDDPTGTQTVHSVPVLAAWDVDGLAPVLSMDRPCFYMLANTRALAPDEACARAEEIGSNLRAAAAKAGVGPLTSVVSRGDSTLRGHYPGETAALAKGLSWGVEGSDVEAPTVVLAPFFAEGGRLTAEGVHYVKGPAGSAPDGDAKLTPAGETEFARDKAFGYSSSRLAEWVAEKHKDSEAPEVRHVSIRLIREEGPDAVAELVTAAPPGCVVICDSTVPRDMQVVALGCLKAELARGYKRPLLYRSAGALVSARAAIPARPLLEASELRPPPHARSGEARLPKGCGLVVVGSYVEKSSQQLAALISLCPWLKLVEVRVADVGSEDPSKAAAEETRARSKLIDILERGDSAVLYTSRTVMQDDGAGGLRIGARVNDILCNIVEAVLTKVVRLSFLVAKGGITSNDVAVRSLGVKRAEVLGAVVPGVPAWRCGPETKTPGMAYVVFPGNVGDKDDLARVVSKMSGRECKGPAGPSAATATPAPSAPKAAAAPDAKAANQHNYKGVFDGGLGFGRKSAVIVVDFTKAYTTPSSICYCGGKGFGVVDAVAESVPLVELARSKKVPVIYTRVYYEHPTDGGVFTQKIALLRKWTPDNPLTEIDPAIKPQAGDSVIIKQYPSAFFGTNLACNLRAINVDTCIIIGCSTSGCIRASVLDGMQHGFRCIVPRECVGDRTESIHESNLFDMNAKNGDVVPKKVVMDYLGSL